MTTMPKVFTKTIELFRKKDLYDKVNYFTTPTYEQINILDEILKQDTREKKMSYLEYKELTKTRAELSEKMVEEHYFPGREMTTTTPEAMDFIEQTYNEELKEHRQVLVKEQAILADKQEQFKKARAELEEQQKVIEYLDGINLQLGLKVGGERYYVNSREER